ncbi:peptidoglycan-binding domain-containing protein [Streptomyces sp. NPDC003877]
MLPAGPGIPAAGDTAVLPAPLVPGTSEPSVTDLRLFDGSGPEPGAVRADAPEAVRPRRRRRTALAAAAAACVAVVAAAGYATGVFSYESPSRDTALPDDLRASVPDAPSSSAASASPESTAPATASASAAPSPSPSASASGSPSPSPSATSAAPSPSRPSEPSASPTPAAPTGPGVPENAGQNGGATVLRRGDSGPEVSELQLRLRQVYLYNDDADGSFDDRLEDAVRTYQWSRGVQTDDLGVYDRQTREKLEAETREP